MGGWVGQVRSAQSGLVWPTPRPTATPRRDGPPAPRTPPPPAAPRPPRPRRGHRQARLVGGAALPARVEDGKPPAVEAVAVAGPIDLVVLEGVVEGAMFVGVLLGGVGRALAGMVWGCLERVCVARASARLAMVPRERWVQGSPQARPKRRPGRPQKETAAGAAHPRRGHVGQPRRHRLHLRVPVVPLAHVAARVGDVFVRGAVLLVLWRRG